MCPHYNPNTRTGNRRDFFDGSGFLWEEGEAERLRSLRNNARSACGLQAELEATGRAFGWLAVASGAIAVLLLAALLIFGMATLAGAVDHSSGSFGKMGHQEPAEITVEYVSDIIAEERQWVAETMGLDANLLDTLDLFQRFSVEVATSRELAETYGSDAVILGLYFPALNHLVVASDFYVQDFYPADLEAIIFRSIIVHELVHAYQDFSGMELACPAAYEELAYTLDQRWLKEIAGLADPASVTGVTPAFIAMISQCPPEHHRKPDNGDTHAH